MLFKLKMKSILIEIILYNHSLQDREPDTFKVVVMKDKQSIHVQRYMYSTDIKTAFLPLEKL